jgi:hypothetical protein
MKMGRSRSGTAVATIMKLPVKRPALPRPAMALPMIRVMEFGATPQSREPISNKNMASRYDFLIENSMKMRPKTG